MEPQRLADLPPDGEHRVQTGHRLLEDHADVVAAQLAHLRLGEIEQVAPLEADDAGSAPGRLRDETQDRHGRDRLAASALAHHGHGLARIDVEGNALDRAHHAVRRAEMRLQPVYLEQRHADQSRFARRGSSASRIPSPSMFTASTAMVRNTAGKNTI